jgi:ribonuclease E
MTTESTSGRTDVGRDTERGGAPPAPAPPRADPPEASAPPKPKIGDTRPAPPPRPAQPRVAPPTSDRDPAAGDGRARSQKTAAAVASGPAAPAGSPARRRRRGRRGRGGGGKPEDAVVDGSGTIQAPAPEAGRAAPETARRARGRERRGRPVGRYLMCVHVQPGATQIAVLEGRSLVEHHVARPADDINQIDGNIYRGRVKNVLPGMEAAFVDIGTPKNAVLYRGDVSDSEDEIDREPGAMRIEHLLRPGQTILCQVIKNPIGLKGARLTQEVSLAGRFVVLVPGSSAYGISKRLDDSERKRLRRILDEVRPEGHGLIVRTAAEGATEHDLRRDVEQLLAKWNEIDAKARRLPAPALLYSEPHMAVRVIREELTDEYRGVLIDDPELFRLVRDYVGDIDPALGDRVEYYDPEVEKLPLFERHHVHEQLHKGLDRKVWLPSGGSLVIERTEALTVIDVNTGKNVGAGSSSLEETVFTNNLEAAEEIARQLRLRDIGGIIVIDFIDMEVKLNRQGVMAAFRKALARDKTPTQVYDISELGLVEMTRKRVGEGLVETLSHTCPICNGRGIIFEDFVT